MNPSEGAVRRFLLVQAGDSGYLLPLTQVDRVLLGLRLFPFPGASPTVAGLAEVGGEPIVVLDTRRLVGAAGSEGERAATVVLARVGPPEAREVVGLAVDEAVNIVELPVEVVAWVDQGVIKGEAVVADQPVRVLDLAAIVGET